MSENRARRLEGQVAIVTGAAQGTGRGAALAFAAEGACVTLFGRTAAKLERVVKEIEARGSQALVVAGDVTQAADRERCVAETLKRFGRISILLNAAIAPEAREGALLDTSREFISQLWDSGFVAVTEFMRLCHPHMKAGGGGSIINVGSIAQQVPKDFTIYGGIKAAVQSMSRGAALEWVGDNIRVNVILPMAVSPSWETYMQNEPKIAEAVLQSLPMRRMGDPERDIGRPCAFLASEDARFITGATLALDGGLGFVR
jgi:NAD(P)-dependent dehydrogenase (short-subunit alcohol dehydrogenase family)